MFRKQVLCCLLAVLVITGSSCTRPGHGSGIRKIHAGQENAGFLTSYVNLKPNPDFENTRSFVSGDPLKNIHKYVAAIVERPQVYISTNADEKEVNDAGVAALTEYFQDALEEAVEDAFPIVQSSGPLVLRLRTAIVGVDVASGGSKPALNIGKVGVEMELVDSETGQQIAAAIDQQNLSGGTILVSREEKFRAAFAAFDGWAARLRAFLDSASERSAEDAARIEETNFPYAVPGEAIK